MLFDAKQFVLQEYDYQQRVGFTSAYFLGSQTVIDYGFDSKGMHEHDKMFAVCNVVFG